jgi:hypothetical protein
VLVYSGVYISMLVLERYKVRTCRPCLSVEYYFAKGSIFSISLPLLKLLGLGLRFPMPHKDLIAKLMGEIVSNGA